VMLRGTSHTFFDDQAWLRLNRRVPHDSGDMVVHILRTVEWSCWQRFFWAAHTGRGWLLSRVPRRDLA